MDFTHIGSALGDSTWIVFGKIAAVIGTIATLITIWKHLTSPKERVVARVDLCPFFLPPTIITKFTSIDESLSYQSLSAKCDALASNDRKLSPPLRDLANHIRDRIPHRPFDDEDGIYGMCVAEIRNTGSRKTKGLRFVVPGSILAMIQREGQTRETKEVKDAIELGDLLPGEVITLVCWSQVRNLADDYRLKQIRVIHDDGVGSIRPKVLALQSIAQFEPLVATWLGFAFLCLMLLSAYIAVTGILKSLGF